ncbi:hypothetical protein NDU88_000580 [Pleurodeles waltl]|uniref:Uncharacterized protein n=1 Tax=Pleurodeles waltl TaxID=8319 RepID=A0AAV7SXQ0_PLEWA|nr:hypothetical protein NDU88_000580 [Pleurodeles waltl]
MMRAGLRKRHALGREHARIIKLLLPDACLDSCLLRIIRAPSATRCAVIPDACFDLCTRRVTRAPIETYWTCILDESDWSFFNECEVAWAKEKLASNLKAAIRTRGGGPEVHEELTSLEEQVVLDIPAEFVAGVEGHNSAAYEDQRDTQGK